MGVTSWRDSCHTHDVLSGVSILGRTVCPEVHARHLPPRGNRKDGSGRGTEETINPFWSTRTPSLWLRGVSAESCRSWSATKEMTTPLCHPPAWHLFGCAAARDGAPARG